MELQLRKLARLLWYALRHRPDALGLSHDSEGWVDVDALLDAWDEQGLQVDRRLLDEVVEADAGNRFEVDRTGRRIRARAVERGQGRPPT